MTTTDVGTNSKIEIEDIYLKKFDGSKQEIITHLIISFHIYESLDSHTLSAEFFLADGRNLVDGFPIIGEEQIVFKMRTPPDKKKNSYEFFVESVKNQQLNNLGNMKYYALSCATKDYLMNSFKVYSRRYYQLDYKLAVQKVITEDLKSKKNVYIEPTKGTFDYMVNRVRPFQTIDLLCEHAVSAKNKSSYFVFYEDSDQYHFRTLEDLIEERKPNATNKKFSMDSSIKDNLKNISWRNILQFETFNLGDGIEKVKNGAIYSKVRKFDISHGDYFSTFEYNDDYMQFKKIDKPYDFNTSQYKNFVTEKPAKTSFICTDELRGSTFNNHLETIPWMRAYRERISQYGVKIRVYGDTDIIVGDVIEINIHKITAADVQDEPQDLFSGNYLIHSLKHKIIREENGDWGHYMILECRKMNLKGAV